MKAAVPMKQFACGDVVPGCDTRFEAEDDAGILGQVATHATEDHGMTEIPDSLVQQVTERISVLS